MRALGLDYGSRTIGIAVSDPMGLTAQGLTTWHRSKDTLDDLNEIKRLIQQYEVDRVILGLPKNLNGSLGPAAASVQDFAGLLTKELEIEVILWDERLTTVEAEKLLLSGDVSRRKRKKVIDKMAATIILQGYLDWQYAQKRQQTHSTSLKIEASDVDSTLPEV